MSAIPRYGRTAICLGGLLFSVATAHANMGNLASTYGVLPADIASAQALSLFNSQVSATYYNPAYLARDPRGELTGGLFHADHELRVNSRGGPDPIVRAGGDVLEDEPSQQVLIGMKTNLTSLTRYDRPLYLGLMVGIERYGKEMLAFNSRTSQEGQFLNYGRQPLFLNIGGATKLWRGIDVGLAARITLHASADLQARSNLAGDTSRESLSVEAKPVFRPIFGLNVNWGETLAPDSDSWLHGLETAFSYRGYSNTHTRVQANAVIPGTIPSPGLDIAIKTLDSFQPEIIAAGVQYQFERMRVGFTGELQRWSRLEDEFERDTIRSQANLSFRDIFIPRLGAEFQLNDIFSVTTGVAYEKSALKSDRSLDVNYLDNDRLVFGLGLSAEFAQAPVFSYPVRLDLGYQYHHLRERNFDLMSSDPDVTVNPYETVSADGEVHVFSGSITLKF